MMTATLLTLVEVFEAVAAMDRRARKAKRIAYAVGMSMPQWCSFANEVMVETGVLDIPDAMKPLIPGTLGNLNGIPVLPQTAPGVALHYR